ncbi:uncharacterized protein LOC124112859 [Haliotis rufescens]|uniref:uncharacterized protein LOC124112859 n=1 Tax=Haliotis rufescens TaxID=6454 RepID=UPI001EAFAC2B|nr:uncharacterized protein LOC124112859 [Haliotis rufescens]
MHHIIARKMVLGTLCLVLFFLVMKSPVKCSNCFDTDSLLKQDSAMVGYIFDIVRPSTIYGCSSECLRSSTCRSFNFDLVTRTCHLNSNISNHTNVIFKQGYVFSDIELWPAALSGPCWGTQCPAGYRCTVNRLDRPACQQEFQGCGSPPPGVPNSEVKYDGHYMGAEAKYTCTDDFRSCHMNSISVCQASTGMWQKVTDLCGRFRFLNTGRADFPCGPASRFTATLQGVLTDNKMEIVIRGATKGATTSTFHVIFRVDRNSITYTTVSNGTFGTTGNVSAMILPPRQDFNIEVQLKEGVYTMAIDGAALPPFPERLANVQPYRIMARGDVNVNTVVIQI